VISSKQRILDFLNEGGPQNLDGLHSFFSYMKDPSLANRTTLRGRLSEMCSDGQLRKHKNGNYRPLTENV